MIDLFNNLNSLTQFLTCIHQDYCNWSEQFHKDYNTDCSLTILEIPSKCLLTVTQKIKRHCGSGHIVSVFLFMMDMNNKRLSKIQSRPE